MKDFHELLRVRRSTRKYTDEEISAEDVKTIMEAALMAPSSKRSLSWEFVLVEEKETLERLATCKEHGSKLVAGAKLAIVVLGDPMKSDVWIEDASIATTIIQLQAEELGLGSCWVQVRNRFSDSGESAEDYVRELLNIPLPMQVLAIVALGHKAEEKAPFDTEKAAWEKVHIGQW
ncbi:MAG: nitroreductase family protein [Coprobacter sp.]|nr:nitroreductase family protein [Coprobacter sp.]